MKNRIFEALRWVKFAMIILAIGISIISCELCIPKGNLCITIEKSSDMAAKTLLQPDIDWQVYKYLIRGVNDSGNSFEEEYFSTGAYTIESLVVGTWTITAEAYNASDERIGSCGKTVLISKNATTSVSMTVAPIKGTGSLSLGISWPKDLNIISPSVEGIITDAQDNTREFECDIDDNSATYNMDLQNGYFTFDLRLLSGDTNIWHGNPQAFRIVTGKTTNAYISLTKSELSGDLEVTINIDLENPLNLTLTSSASIITTNDTITINSAIDKAPDSWHWYLDGTPVSTAEHSLSLGPSLAVGRHWVSLIVKKGAILGSADCIFDVIEVEASSGINEDFNDGLAQGWEMDSDHWKLENSKLMRYGMGNGRWEIAYYSDSEFNGAFSYQTDISMKSGYPFVAKGLFIHCCPAPPLFVTDVDELAGYIFMIDGDQYNGYGFWVGRSDGKGNLDWSGWIEYTPTPSIITMKVVTDGAGYFIAYLNDDPVFYFTDNSPFTEGYVGLATYDAKPGYEYISSYDNVRLITNPSSSVIADHNLNLAFKPFKKGEANIFTNK